MLSTSWPRSAANSAGPSTSALGAMDFRGNRPDADIDASEPGEFAFEDEKLAGRQQHGIADVEFFGAADAELAGRRTADQERDQVAVGIEPALGEGDQGACHRLAFRHDDHRFEPLVGGQLPHGGRRRQHLAAGARAAFREIEAQDLVDAFEPDINDIAVARERLGVVPEPLLRDRPALGIEHRGRLDIVEPDHLAAGIADAAGEPAALVGDRKEALALWIEPDAGQAAEAAIG
ncbi:hypothetical protein ACVMGC_005630 [Bradyrhizobium barranii subsp. barranii]